MSLRIAVIRPCGREKGEELVGRLEEIRQRGHLVKVYEHTEEVGWSYNSGTIKSRFDSFWRAVTDPNIDVLWCVRGGYGAADLVSHIEWEQLRKLAPKIIVGFSDVCALHSAFLHILGWRGLHAPMPGTELWHGIESVDVSTTMDFLETKINHVDISLLDSVKKTISGPLFGGCLTVLSGLIGTPFFPKTLADNILFFEDTGENPGRILRNLRQWELSGAFRGVRAVILGIFRDSQLDSQDSRRQLARRIEDYFQIPTMICDQFGHVGLNYPVGVGFDAVINESTLTWRRTSERNRLSQS